MRYERLIDTQLQSHFKKFKQILLLLGARQVGKTTVLRRIFKDALYINFDFAYEQEIFNTHNLTTYKSYIRDAKVLVLDEVHLLKEPGRALKILYDNIPGLKLVVTGSASLDIRMKTEYPLAGRVIEYRLFPLTFAEYVYQLEIEEKLHNDFLEVVLSGEEPPVSRYPRIEVLENVLRYGTYPEVLNTTEPERYLRNLADTVIFKDIVDLKLVGNLIIAKKLLQLLAYQIGNVINYSELARKVGVDRRTIERYIEIFEQNYIVFRLYPFVGDPRARVVKSPKIYFFDVGLRNALIGDFRPMSARPDKGSIFENFIISEVYKYNWYGNYNLELYFWKPYEGAEVDLVIVKNGDIFAVEIKHRLKRVTFANFLRYYPEARTVVVTPEYVH